MVKIVLDWLLENPAAILIAFVLAALIAVKLESMHDRGNKL